METKRMKEDHGTVNVDDPVLEDRISELPDDVILRILSLLPTIVAARTSFLSKRWRRMWSLLPMVDIDMSRDVVYFSGHDKKSIWRKRLIKCINMCLKYPFPSTAISKFTFRMEYHGSCNWIDALLRYPILKDVKELELEIKTKNIYFFPQFILRSSGLTWMRLSSHRALCNFLLEPNFPVCLPLLRELCLEYVFLYDTAVNDLLSGCPALEKLKIYSCLGKWNPEFSSSSLKYMEFCPGSRANQAIRVEASDLQWFVFHGVGRRNCSADLAGCPAIRSINLIGVCLDEKWLKNWFAQFTLLESLKLSNCYGLRTLKIRNQNLKSIAFESDLQLETQGALIDPIFKDFSYPQISMYEISVNAPNLVNVDLRYFDRQRETFDREWYVSLIKFLSEFNRCKSAYMFFPSEMALIVPDEVRKLYDSPLPNLKYLMAKTARSESYLKTMFRDSLLWIAPSLETLTIE